MRALELVGVVSSLVGGESVRVVSSRRSFSGAEPSKYQRDVYVYDWRKFVSSRSEKATLDSTTKTYVRSGVGVVLRCPAEVRVLRGLRPGHQHAPEAAREQPPRHLQGRRDAIPDSMLSYL